MTLARIVSGGQTGVDRAALDAALAARFPCGGWCPEGRKAEDGRVPDHYPVVILPGSGYRARTLKNVVDSDGTVIAYSLPLSGGTKLTRDFCIRAKKPFVVVDATTVSVSDAIDGVIAFIAKQQIAVLNVAGPWASGWPEGYRIALNIVAGVIQWVRGAAVDTGIRDVRQSRSLAG